MRSRQLFLVLLKKGDSVRPRDQVGAWLHGVARRTALKAKSLAARNQRRERPMIDWPVETTPTFDHRDWLPLLDRELDRLPEKYRAVVVLCDLQGQSRREAATRLRLSEGTLSSRLARARAMLGNRLRRRGVVVSTAMFIFSDAAAAATPVELAAATHSALMSAAANTSVASGLSILSQGVIQAMFMSKLVRTFSVALVILAFSAGMGTTYFLRDAYADKPVKPADPANKPVADKPAKPAQGESLVGEIKAVDAGQKTVTVLVRVPGTKQSKEGILALDKDLVVSLLHGLNKESKPGKIEDLSIGAPVTIQLTADKKAVAHISISGGNVSGGVKAVDPAKKSITIVLKNEKQQMEKTFELFEGAKIFLDDGFGKKGEPAKEGKLDDLKEGLSVNIQLSGYDRTKAVSIRASGPTLSGTVSAIDLDKSTITITSKGEGEKTVPVSKEVKVMSYISKEVKTAVDGKFADIAVGAHVSVRLSVEDGKTAVGIAVKE